MKKEERRVPIQSLATWDRDASGGISRTQGKLLGPDIFLLEYIFK